jgi:hypothetical protein
MPKMSQGDIFQAAARVQLAIVFGHIGFNEMRQRWVTFAQSQPQLSHANNPFTEFGGRAVEWSGGKWLWFVPEKENHGMTEAQLTDALDAAFAWASRNRIASVATNGVANIDHGQNTATNRRSDEERAAWLKDYAKQAEQKHNVAIELISLNDVFVRGNE